MQDNTKRLLQNTVILFLFFSLLTLTALTWFGDIQPGGTARRQAVGELFGGRFWAGSEQLPLYEGYEEYDYTMRILAPVRVGVQNEMGLTYHTDRDAARELFERAGTLLAAALESADARTELSEYRWHEHLTGELLLLDFEGEMPLDLLAASLGAEHFAGEEAQARYLTLRITDDALTMAVVPKHGTPVLYETAAPAAELAAMLAEFETPNAQFACADRAQYHDLPAETVVMHTREYPAVLQKTAAFTDFTSTASERIIQAVLECFGYNAYATGGYIEADATRVYVDELRTLRIAPNGALSYAVPELAATGEPAREARADIIRDAAATLDRVASDYLGDVTLYIQRTYYDAAAGRYVILFGCAVDGIALSFPDGYFARLAYADTTLAAAHLSMAGYVRTAETDILMQDAQTAAALPHACDVFELRYAGNENGKYHAKWYYGE